MKKAIALFLLLSVPAWAEEFRDATFGMSLQEVRATEEDADWVIPEKGVLAFDTELAGNDVSAGYILLDDRFVRGVYFMSEVYQNKNDHLTDFEYLDQLLTKKYGKPKKTKTNWKDYRWKDSPAYYGHALQQGDFSISTEWKTKTTLITHSIYAEDYEIIHRIDYASLEMPDVEEQKVLDDL